MSLQHLEDLPIDQFIDSLNGIDEFVMSEKVDGCELAFGFDNSGTFFTTRECKGGKRFYSASEWPNQIWTNAFKGAHLFLEKHKKKLQKMIPANQLIEVELLFGAIPNTVEYDLNGVNRIVFLRGVGFEIDFKEIYDAVGGREVSVRVPDILFTDDGFNIHTRRSELQTWKFEIIDCLPIPKFNTKIRSLLDSLNNYLKHSDLIEVSKRRITKNNRLSVESARSELLLRKTQIKDLLVEQIFKNTRSKFMLLDVPKHLLSEGLVFRNLRTGFQFKLVDKHLFTKLNREKHSYTDLLRDVCWLSLHSKIRKLLDIKKIHKADITSTKDIREISKLSYQSKSFQEVQSKILFMITTSLNFLDNELLSWNIKRIINERQLNDFAGLRYRLLNLQKCIAMSSTFEHMIEAYIFEEFTLKREKTLNPSNAATQDDVSSLIQMLSNKIPDLDVRILGSAACSEIMGDIDIGVNEKDISVQQFLTLFPEATPSLGLNIVHLPLTINEKQIQVDVMFCKNLDWAEFYYRGRTNKSRYKGVYRNCLLRGLTMSSNITKVDETGTIYEKSGWVIVGETGLENQIRERKLLKSGNRAKSFSKISTSSIISEPDKAVFEMFKPNVVTLDDIRDFESLWVQICKYKTEDEIKKIISISSALLMATQRTLPEEFLVYESRIYQRT